MYAIKFATSSYSARAHVILLAITHSLGGAERGALRFLTGWLAGSGIPHCKCTTYYAVTILKLHTETKPPLPSMCARMHRSSGHQFLVTVE